MYLVLCLCLIGVDNSATDRVESAARRFRITSYTNHRLDRAEFDRRQAAAEEMLNRWRVAKEPASEVERVIEWYQSAAATPAGEPIPEHPILPPPEAEPPTPPVFNGFEYQSPKHSLPELALPELAAPGLRTVHGNSPDSEDDPKGAQGNSAADETPISVMQQLGNAIWQGFAKTVQQTND